MTRKLYLLISLLWCFLTTAPIFAGNTHSHSRLIALDVKEGQSILLQHNNRGLLFDTGHAGEALNLLKKLNHYGVTELDAIIFTHLHPDHASAYFRIKEAFPGSRIYSNCQPIDVGKAPEISRWVAEDLQDNPEHQCLSSSDSLSFGDSELDILWPYKIEGNNLNYNSLVIHIKMKQRNVLLMGDVNKAVEKKLLDTGRLPNKIDTLIVGHHGWHDSSSEALLKHLKPTQAIISINANNARGYPHVTTIQRLHRHSGSIKRTDVSGDIFIVGLDTK